MVACFHPGIDSISDWNRLYMHKHFFMLLDPQKSFPACWCVLGEKGSHQLSLVGHFWAWSAVKWVGFEIQLHLEGHCSEGCL